VESGRVVIPKGLEIGVPRYAAFDCAPGRTEVRERKRAMEPSSWMLDTPMNSLVRLLNREMSTPTPIRVADPSTLLDIDENDGTCEGKSAVETLMNNPR
jgi:hypothetical protein